MPKKDINPQENRNIEDNIQDSNDVLDFIDIVNTIVYYYSASSTPEELDSSENWKKEAGINNKIIPQDVDDTVKKAFIKQLKRFL